jgi:hypothetical protein
MIHQPARPQCNNLNFSLWHGAAGFPGSDSARRSPLQCQCRSDSDNNSLHFTVTDLAHPQKKIVSFK